VLECDQNGWPINPSPGQCEEDVTCSDCSKESVDVYYDRTETWGGGTTGNSVQFWLCRACWDSRRGEQSI
jgi:hypothetical protein